MSERENLADVLHKACGNSFSDIVRLAIADVVLAAGYRLVATEGPEFEAIETAIRILKPIADDMEKVSHRPDYRYRTSSGGRACLDAYRVLRAALETGERDG